MKPSVLAINACLLAVATTLVAARPAAAASIPFTNQGTPVVADSGAGSIVVTPWNLDNTTAYNFTITSLGSLSFSYVSHNPNDVVTGVTFDNDVAGNTVGNCYVGEVIDNGQNCNIELMIDVAGAAPTLAHIEAYGVNTVADSGFAATPLRADVPISGSGAFETDVVYTPTPEPESLALLGSGLLTLAGAALRKRQALRV